MTIDTGKNTESAENADSQTDANSIDGTVNVHESVIASIAKKAVLSTDGVIRLSGSSFFDNIAEMVGSRKTFDKAIVITMGKSDVAIEARIVVRYGSHIPEIASAVQKNVYDDVTRLTGMSLSAVNVVVMDLDDDTVKTTPGED